jgi:hypothetical protein
MSPTEISTLIEHVGGITAFGRMLGIDDGEGWQQRINNWRHRGLPPAVELQHYDLLKALRLVANHRKMA